LTNSFEAAESEFHWRYFDWCIKQIHLAAEDDFRRVKGICGHYAGIFRDFLEEFGPAEGLNVCVARLKKAHPGVLQTRGESLSPSEDMSISRFNDFTRVGGAVMRIPRVIRERWPGKAESHPQDKLDGDEIRSVLGPHLSKQFGQPVKRGAREFLEFRHSIHDWVVFTNVTAEEDIVKWSIRYSHTVAARSDLDGRLIGASISYLAWLGFPTTQWDYVSREDLNPIASMLSEFIDMFLSATPALLTDLRNPLKIC
jgi:hypothetical protein